MTAALDGARDAIPGADFNLKIAQPLLRWVAETQGSAKAEEIARNAGIARLTEKGSTWISLESFESILQQVRALVPDDAAFKRVCAHRMHETYGPLRYMFWALSPALVYSQALKNFRPISSITTGVVTERGPDFTKVRITSRRPESRLVCLSRQGQAVVLPGLWGLPPAHLTEGKCIGLGDECCEYEIRWYRPRSWVPPVLGLVAGLGGASVMRALGASWIPLEPVLGASAALLGAYWDLRRTHTRNLEHARGIHAALEDAVRDDVQVRVELLDLHRRQADWSRMLEEQISERTRSLRQVVEHIRELREQRVVKLRGYSHDLRNPLTAIRLAISSVRAASRPSDPLGEALDEADQAVDRITDLLDEMLAAAHSEATVVTLVPQRIDIPTLSDSLRRRLRALVLGRNIRATVVSTREAPASIETDLILFDRVIDNLLTNAAKYTDSGSIVIQLDGRPGFLVLQVSDTGCGMDPEHVEEVFKGRPSRGPAAAGSFGVGLSVVVNLLAQVNGSLEVMTLPGRGTTFWALIPTTIQPPDDGSKQESSDDRVRRVVKIRRQVNA
ncbi:MAG: HAMP domain-containing histidine kinase [Deltaproteobacteria bacterium]|nr:HAMP domain-containing histidine kinase [Deltaproteobacteria bacterium]